MTFQYPRMDWVGYDIGFENKDPYDHFHSVFYVGLSALGALPLREGVERLLNRELIGRDECWIRSE